jgi:hypothetical protein
MSMEPDIEWQQSLEIPNNGKKRLHIGVRSEAVVHLCEYIFLAPPSEPLVDDVPFTIISWQKSPLSTATSHPQDSFDKEAGCIFVADIDRC